MEALGSSQSCSDPAGICFAVAAFSKQTPRFVNSQLICLPPAGIFNKYYVQFVYLRQRRMVSATVLDTSMINFIITLSTLRLVDPQKL